LPGIRKVWFITRSMLTGHADTRMTEKHYAHLAPSYVAQAIRANFPRLGLSGTAQIIPIHGDGHRVRNA
jgi:hypothetical protein